MGKILTEGQLGNKYSIIASIENAKGEIRHSALYNQRQISVFISHKHDDLNNLKEVIGFLESEYNVNAYIDSKDSSLPEKPSSETAKRIKERIDQCDKFILLATNKAIESKWCNWELGYGDAKKYKSKIALFPMMPQNSQREEYLGNEYMRIYPYILYYDGIEKFTNTNRIIPKGYYVKNYEDNPKFIIPLAQWLNI